jgi:hypothetical protein
MMSSVPAATAAANAPRKLQSPAAAVQAVSPAPSDVVSTVKVAARTLWAAARHTKSPHPAIKAPARGETRVKDLKVSGIRRESPRFIVKNRCEQWEKRDKTAILDMNLGNNTQNGPDLQEASLRKEEAVGSGQWAVAVAVAVAVWQ